MTLLDDLQALDFSAVLDARASISLSTSGGGLPQLSASGAGALLGDVGGALDSLSRLSDPADLIAPLVAAAEELAGSLGAQAPDIAGLVAAVREGAELIARLFGGLGEEPVLGRVLGGALEQLASTAEHGMAGFMDSVGGELDNMHALVARAEGGLPTQPAALAEFLVEALVPFDIGDLRGLRAAADALLNAAATLRVDGGRASGLVVALDAVAVAAAAGDVAGIERSLALVARARAVIATSLAGDLARIRAAVEGLPIDRLTGLLASAKLPIGAVSTGAVELLDGWRRQIVRARAELDELDPEILVAVIPPLLALAERTAREWVVDPIETEAQRLEDWARTLLSGLPFRRLRNEVTSALHDLAQTIEDAHLERGAQAIQELLDEVMSTVEHGPQELAAAIQAQVQAAAQAIDGALDAIEGALASIRGALEGVATQATDVIDRAAAALGTFRDALQGVTSAIDGLGIEAAGQQVVDRLRDLRTTVEELVGGTALPEPLRPVVAQLSDALESFDVEALIATPVRAAAAELAIPAAVGAQITAALEAAGDVLQQLVPANLAAELAAELQDALEPLRAFDPATLLSGVSEAFTSATAAIGDLDMSAIGDALQPPFALVLEAVDALEPHRLLAPAVEAYAAIMGSIPAPSPQEAAREAASLANAAGERVGQAGMAPAMALLPGGADPVEPGQPAVALPALDAGDIVAPGDIVRVLAFIPARLHDALAALAAGPAGEAAAAVDGLTGGLARTLRAAAGSLRAAAARLDGELAAALAPVAAAQARAQLALQSSFGIHAEAGPAGAHATFDLDASMNAVALAGPGPLYEELAGELGAVRLALGTHGDALGGSAALERAATALESMRLGQLGSDLDGLLAALDPEPLAAEVDALAAAALKLVPELSATVVAQIRAAAEGLSRIAVQFSPTRQAQRYFKVLEILGEELALLDPKRLADELAEIHSAVRAALTAYDPAQLVAQVQARIEALATALAALDPAALLGDLSLFDELRQRLDSVSPAAALDGISDGLDAAGAALTELDPAALLASLDGLGPRVADQVALVVDAVRDEIVGLLESLRYVSGEIHASASVQV